MPLRLVHVLTVPKSLIFLEGHVRHAKAHGAEVIVIASPGAQLDRFGRDEEVVVVGVEMPRQVSPLADVVTVARLVRVLRARRPDLVHSHTPKGGLLGMVAASVARVPNRIYHIRGLPYMTATGRRRRLLMATERVSCRLAHRVICVSHSIREVAVDDGLCPPEKITVLLGGSGAGVDATGRFDPDRRPDGERTQLRDGLGIDDEALVVGFVGRIVVDKGIEPLTDAWTELRDRHPDAHLVLVGAIEPQDPVPDAVLDRLRGDERVHLVGEVDDTAPWYSAFDLVVLPTYREGFPNVPLEAAAMALPVVATDIPGCRDAVADGTTGVLVPPRDAAALGDAIDRYLGDADLRREHGTAGRRRAFEQFGQEALREALWDEYQTLLARTAPPH